MFNFSSLIAEHNRDFVGREWFFAEIDAWLADPNAPRYFIITGEPGIGKTAIAARLTKIRHLDAHHFCIARNSQTVDPLNFACSISQQLMSIEGFTQGILQDSNVYIDAQQNIRELSGQATNVNIKHLIVNAPSATSTFNRVVLEPLRVLYTSGYNQQLIILVDALDEATQLQEKETIVDLLANARGLPPQIRFVLTSRPESTALRYFENLNIPHLLLDAGRAENQQDVHAYVQHRVTTSTTLQTHISEQATANDDFVKRVVEASGGNFLYLIWLLSGIETGPHRPDTLNEFPHGLDGVYREFLRTRALGANKHKWRDRYRPLLGILATAQTALTIDQLVAFTDLNKQTVWDVLDDVRQFLNPVAAEEKLYYLYHQSVVDFLSDEERAEEFWIDIHMYHHQITDYYISTYKHDWASCNDTYALKYLFHHLAEVRNFEVLQHLIQNRVWYKAQLNYDFSRQKYTYCLDITFSAATSQGVQGWSHIVTNSWQRATIAGIAKNLPDEIYETLVRLGRGQEALQRARLVSEVTKQVQLLHLIENTAQELGDSELFKQVQLELKSLPVSNDTEQIQNDEDSLVTLVCRYGVEKALSPTFVSSPSFDSDGSKAIKLHFKVALAASKCGKQEDAHDVLLKSLVLVNKTWEHERCSFLSEIARMLIDFGYPSDLERVVDEALKIEIKNYRGVCLAELAVICADIDNLALTNKVLCAAIKDLDAIDQGIYYQSGTNKIALAMAKIRNDRAKIFFQDAIKLAENPVQPSSYWLEQRAWQFFTITLISLDMLDEALVLLKHKHYDILNPRILVGLALNDKWDACKDLLKEVSPQLHDGAALDILYALAKKDKANTDQWQTLFTRIETNLLGSQHQQAHHLRLGRLVDIAQLCGYEDRTKLYLTRMWHTLKDADRVEHTGIIMLTAQYAAKLQHIDMVHTLRAYVEALPEDDYYGVSDAIAAIAHALVEMGATNEGQSLAATIPGEGQRFECYINICEMLLQREAYVHDYLEEILGFALQLDPSDGWLPPLWGRLALLAHRAGNKYVKETATSRAVNGTGTISSSYPVSFNVHNSARVAQSFYKMDMVEQSYGWLKFGLQRVYPAMMFDTSSLHSLIEAISATGAHDLWPDVFQAVQQISDASQRAAELLYMIPAIEQPADSVIGREALPVLLKTIQESGKEEFVLKFGDILNRYFAADVALVDKLLAQALAYARLQNRPTVLLWVAAFLPVCDSISNGLAVEVWRQLQL
ncbi:MAG: ATP-binding protein [Anaerolineae bacterium]|nr:ATP-binding protein [Anaerolineae bacterium]